MQKIIKTIVLTALSLFICLPAGAKTDAEVHKILEEVAEDYRASLPMSVNTNTTWYGARRDLIAKRRLVYLYRLKIPETSKIAELKSLIDATKNNMKSREVIVITITTH